MYLIFLSPCLCVVYPIFRPQLNWLGSCQHTTTDHIFCHRRVHTAYTWKRWPMLTQGHHHTRNVFFIGHFLFKAWSGVSYPDATCQRITTFLHFKRNIALPPHTFACALAFIWQAKCIGAAQPKLVTLFSGAQSGWWLKLILNFPDEKTLLIEVFLSALCS